MAMHSLVPGQSVVLSIGAGERYSGEGIAVKPGEQYRISCDRQQRWTDMIIPSSPDGYPNPLAKLCGLRVRTARCFCLCGAWGRRDATAFAIGSGTHTIEADQHTDLTFFANDVRGFEWNNWGSISLTVTRIS